MKAYPRPQKTQPKPLLKSLLVPGVVMLAFWGVALWAWLASGYLRNGQSEASPPSRLTPRENEIVQLLAEGKSNKEVAVALGITVKTAETHRTNILRKLELHSLADLVRYAVRNKIIEP